MYIYKFEYAYFDEYYCFELKHKEKYSKDDLKKIQERRTHERTDRI